MARTPFVCFAALMLLLTPMGAQPPVPDAVLVNGTVLSADRNFSIHQALAIREGRITALGTTPDIRRLAGSGTRIIDLQGRAVIPGLIDSHMHAIRAALSFATEVHWIGAPTLKDALARVSDAARRMKPGAWLIVAGGWTERQFAEKRRPTQAELVAAAPDNPVYVQLGYQWALMTPQAMAALKIARDEDVPGGRLERGPGGAPTGAISAPQPLIVALFDRLPKPTYAEKVDGTRKFFRELNRLGLTGVIDPGGNNMTPAEYQALFDVWRRGELTVRVAFSMGAQGSGGEFEELTGATSLLPMGFGDDLLRFNGLGERITGGMYNNDRPTDDDKAAFERIALWAARRGVTLTAHWNNDASVGHLLEVLERVNRQVAIAPLRWSIAHLNDATPATLSRMNALGVGWTVQDAMYFNGDGVVRQRGAEAARRIPPIETARKAGVVIGAGTDAHRVASYNPFTALQWLLDGRTVEGTAMRAPDETPSRADALRMYTSGSAWFAHADDRRGSLEVGKLADLAVLSKDYMTVSVDQIGGIESLLTMVGGRVVYAAAPYSEK